MFEWIYLLFAGGTMIATAATAVAVWRQWQGLVQVEWKHAWSQMYERSIPPILEVEITIRNHKNFGVVGRRVEATGCPVLDLRIGDRNQRKHESWKPHESPLSLDIDPGASKSVTLIVALDWVTLSTRRSVIKRPKSSAALRIQISVASKARRRWITKAKTKIDIPNAMIAKAAAVAKK